MTDRQDRPTPSRESRTASEAVAQRPTHQPAPARMTRPIATGGARPDLPDFVTRAVRR